MVQYMHVFSTSVEMASKRPLVKSSYSSKCSNNPLGIILTRIVCLAPAWCTGSVCIQLHWENSCFRKSRIGSFLRCQIHLALGIVASKNVIASIMTDTANLVISRISATFFILSQPQLQRQLNPI